MANLDYIIHELLPAQRTVGESMQLLIDAHTKVYPSGDWAPFRGIDYDREIPRLVHNWFPDVMQNDPPAKVPIAGLWFGLFQPVIGSGRTRETVADFYVAGARQFELDGDAEWACGPEYFPEGRYANSNVLANIYRAAYSPTGGLGNDAEQYLCLGYVAFTLKFLLADIDLRLILATGEPVGVAIGWDSGNPMYVGFVTENGYEVRNPKEAIAAIKKRQEAFAKWFEEKYGKEP